MEKIEEKNLKKKNNSIEETQIITDLNEIIKKETKEKQNTVKPKNQILQKKVENTAVEKKEKNKIETPKTTKTDIVKEAEKVVRNTENNSEKSLEIKQEPKQKNKSKIVKALKIILIILLIMLLALIFSTIFSLININNKKIMDGVSVNGINISNLTKQEAIDVLNNKLNSNEQNYITVYRNGVTDTVYLKDINASFDVESAVNEAYKIGREGNIVKCNYEILATKILKKSVKSNIQFDNNMLSQKIEEISINMPDVALGSSYVINQNNLIIKNSKDGYKIKNEEFEKNMIEAFSSANKNFEIPVEKAQREKIDIEKIHNEIYKDAKNAYYTTNPYKIYKEENGLDFAISVQEAEKLLLENKEEFIIPLKVIEPSIKISDLGNEAFPNQLATFTTYYGTGDSGRCYNIYLAAKSITETVVMPGETFSYNDLIGECSTRTGYKESTIYLNGKLAKGIGGGICQVSTTLYNAVLGANLEIVERRNHSLSVTYVPLGHDAMVSIGSSDFKFKNNRNYPIKVIATTGTGSVTCQIYGLKNQTEYDVKLDTKVISKTDTKTKTQTYKVLYLNGKEVSRTLLSTDTYKNH